MLLDRQQMIQEMRRVVTQPLGNVFHAEPRPMPATRVFLHPCRRFILVLSGEKHCSWAWRGKRHDRIFQPGDWIVGYPGAWINEYWDRPHEMVSIVFYEEFIRTLYIKCPEGAPENVDPTCFYHTSQPPGGIIRAGLTGIFEGEPGGSAERNFLQAVATLVLEQMEREDPLPSPQEKEEKRWRQLFTRLQFSFYHDIVRADIAEGSGIHPAKLSRMIRKHTGMGLREYLNSMRMEYAKSLLQQEKITVDEVARQCGYNYTSYFIRVFRHSEGCSPGEFRQRTLPNGPKS